MSNTH